SCYAWREDVERLVDLFNRTVEPVVGRTYLGTHLCFGNFKGRAVAPRRYAPMFPAFLGLAADELHLEMTSREFAELELIEEIAREARLEAREDVVHSGPASVGPHGRGAARVAAEQQPVGVAALGEIGDQRQDRRIRPVLRSAGTVELQPRACGRRLGVLAGIW